MGFSDYQYKIKVKDQRAIEGHSTDGDIASGCLVFVYDAGTKTLSTLYSNDNRAALANPITRSQFATDAGISFYSASASHDIFINDDKGNSASYSSVAPTVHSLYLNRASVSKCLVFPMVFNAGGTEVDTGLDLPLDALVYDARVEVVTVDATETVHIGLLASETNGDADGFLATVSVANAGYPAIATYTTGSNETYLSANTYGVLLASGSLGTDLATDVGSLHVKGHVVTGANAKSISYTPSTSDTFAGYGYVFFKLVR